MSISDLQQLAGAVNTGGVVTLLLFGLVALTYGAYKEWWVPGPTHRREVDSLREERNAWRTIALGLGNTAERSVVMAEQQLGVSLGPPGAHGSR